MKNNNSVSLYTEEISKVLEPSITFVNGGYGDNVRHHIDFSFIEFFSYLALYVVMPILTGIVSNKLSDLIHIRGGNKVKLGIEDGYMSIHGEKEFLDKNVITMDELISIMKEQEKDDEIIAQASINVNKAEEALMALTEFLISNGWPERIAKVNAGKIINFILKTRK